MEGIWPNAVAHAEVIKGEDVLLCVPPDLKEKCPVGIYAVFDGHAGVEAARYCSQHIIGELRKRLPQVPCPVLDSPLFQPYAEHLQMAITSTFLVLELGIRQQRIVAGSTATVVIQTGALLTIANVGDSNAVLDTGDAILDLITDFRIGKSTTEMERIEREGATLARLKFDLSGPVMDGNKSSGLGPLRTWPGGLLMSRAMGDVPCGPYILAYPAIRQVLLPKPPCRLIVASDGVWDALETTKACAAIRSHPLPKCAQFLCRKAVEQRIVHDDTSAIIVDFLAGPSEDATTMPFRLVAKKFGRQAPRRSVVMRRMPGTGEVLPMSGGPGLTFHASSSFSSVGSLGGSASGSFGRMGSQSNGNLAAAAMAPESGSPGHPLAREYSGMLLSESPAGAQSIRRPGASGGSNVRASSSGGMMGWMCSSEPSDVVDPDTDIIDPATMAIVIVADQIDSFYQFAAGKETKDKPITQTVAELDAAIVAFKEKAAATDTWCAQRPQGADRLVI